MSGWKPVTEKYFGQDIGDGQNPDEPGCLTTSPEGIRITGRGSQTGGSKPSVNPGRKGNATLGSSRPKSAQKLRG